MAMTFSSRLQRIDLLGKDCGNKRRRQCDDTREGQNERRRREIPIWGRASLRIFSFLWSLKRYVETSR